MVFIIDVSNKKFDFVNDQYFIVNCIIECGAFFSLEICNCYGFRIKFITQRINMLNELTPYQGGGDMIAKVSFEKTTYNELPFKFEAGTPNIAGAICLGEAFRYLEKLDKEAVFKHEADLLELAETELSKIDGLRIIGTADHKISVVSFVVDGLHPFDIGTLLDKQGIAVRTGHHCTQPLMDIFDIPGTVRASFAFYNTKEEVHALVAGVERAVNMLR